MSMKHAFRAIAAIGLVTALTGCDTLFSGNNLFASMDGPDAEALSSETGTTLLSSLTDSQSSDGTFGSTFVSSLSDEQVETVLTSLKDIADDTSGTYTDSDKASAATLSADLILAATDAGTVVNSLVSSVLPDITSGTVPDMGTVLGSVFGDDVTADSFASMAESLLSLSDAYSSLNTTLTSSSDATTIATDLDLGLGDAQSAIISIVFSTLVDTAVTSGTATDSTEAISQIFTVLVEPTVSGGTIDSTAVADMLGGSDISTVLTDVLSSTGDYASLYTATGADALLSMLQ